MKNNRDTGNIVLACAMGVMLLIAAIVSLTSLFGGLAALSSLVHDGAHVVHDYSDDGWDGYYGHHFDDDGHHGDSDHGGTRSYADDLIVVNPGQVYTFDQLEELYGVQPQKGNEGKLYAGIYEVVPGSGDLGPGIYRMNGDQEDMSHFCIFTPATTAQGGEGYKIKAMVEYFGDYFAEFSEGELVIFTPDNDRFAMERASDAPLRVSNPLDSGCYRVGIDIPAGTYSLSIETISQDEIEYSGSTPGAFVMQDVRFDADSVTETVPVVAGGSATVTVRDGEYLELFGVRAIPAN